MKHRITALVIAALFVLTLGACTKEEAPKGANANFGKGASDIYIYNDLAVQDVAIADFDTSKYDKDEYLSYLQEEIDAYNQSASFVPQTAAEGEENFTPHYTVPVSVASCTVSDNKLNQQILYATAADFVQYNQEFLEAERGGYTLQAGKLAFADASVTGASLIDPDNKEGGTLNVQEILTGKNADRYRYVICNFNAVLYGDGEVAGYTSNGSYNADLDCVTVPAGQTVVVVFKQ